METRETASVRYVASTHIRRDWGTRGGYYWPGEGTVQGNFQPIEDKNTTRTGANRMKKYFTKAKDVLNNIGSYLRAVATRRKRRRKEKEEDPFIYPIF